MNRPHHQRGFTLLEILVAFMLLALVGGALLQLFQGGLRNLDSSAEITHAALLAKSKLTELSALGEVQPGNDSGRFDDRYRWELALEPYLETDALLPESAQQPLRATIDIRWNRDGLYRLQTLLLSRREGP